MIPLISEPESLTAVTGSVDERAAAFDLLADWRRRAVLRYLHENETESPVSLADLADHVTLEQRDRETGPIAGCGDALLGTRRRVHISLRHTHVPKLAAADAVAFDPDADTVSLRETGAELLDRTDAIDESADACKHQSE